MSVPRPPLSHPLAPGLDQAVDSLGAALRPDTIRHYRGTVRKFLTWLGAAHPQVDSLDLLRRDPHILGWMSCLRSQTPPLATASYTNLLIHLRSIFQELAWTQPLPELAHLIRRQDVPRLPKRLPRPLSAQQDQLLQQEFLRRNDLGGNAFLLIRHTGMRIGECADLSYDCLRSTAPINGPFISRSVNSTPNAWSRSIPLSVLWFSACASFAPSIRCPPMEGSWLAPAPKMPWFINSATTSTRSVMPSASPPAWCRIR